MKVGERWPTPPRSRSFTLLRVVNPLMWRAGGRPPSQRLKEFSGCDDSLTSSFAAGAAGAAGPHFPVNGRGAGNIYRLKGGKHQSLPAPSVGTPEMKLVIFTHRQEVHEREYDYEAR